MVELTVALLAGLVVAMGIVALSRDATNTFHDEARASVAEASLRAAMDRLRADLQRAGYMSTPNFLNDPMVAAAPGRTPDASLIGSVPGITQLQSLRITQALPAPALSTVNGVDSDVVEISGNMTGADQFDVAYIGPQGACQKIYLSNTSPAMYRLIGDGGATADLLAAFQPAPNTQFIVRLVDDTGHTQFLVTCAAGAAGIDVGVNLPFVGIDTTKSPIQTAQTTGTTTSLTGPAAGRAWVNPVATVRWEIMTTALESSGGITQYVNGLPTQTPTGGADLTKYDLVRTFLDIGRQEIPSTSEVVAEYVVDLKLAVSAAGTLVQAPNQQATAVDITSYAFGATENRTIAAAITAPGGGGGVPQRIRSVRARLVTRAGQADRTAIIAPPATGGTTDGYLYRYCVLPGGCTSNGTTYQYARARTLTTEAALPNQARIFY
jgi:Tfp pilus assembly protein PilW